MSSDQYCSPRQAAVVLSVQLGWVYTLLWGGKLKARKSRTGRWQISVEALEARKRDVGARRAA